jgi:hypothetical protein
MSMLQAFMTLFLLLMVVCLSPVSATTASIDPTTVTPGQTVTITVDPLPKDVESEIVLDAQITTTPGEAFNFTVGDLKYNCNLDPADLNATISGLSDDDPCKLYIKQEDQPFIPGGEIIRKGYPVNGTFEVYAMQHIEPLTHQAYFTGTADSSVVKVKLAIKGKKISGPDKSVTTLSFSGLSQGSCTIGVYVDNTLIKTENVLIKQ